MNSRSLTLGLACAALSIPLPAAAQIANTPSDSSAPAPYTAEFHITQVQTLANGATITRERKEVMARDSQGRTMISTTQIPSTDGQPSFTNVHVHAADRTDMDWNSISKQVHIIHEPPQGSTGCWSTAPVDSPGGVSTMALAPPPDPPRPAAAGGGTGFGAGSGGGFAGSVQLPDGPAAAPRPASAQRQREDLGTDTIMGVEVRGYRTTRTTPAGRVGNDVPLVRTEELWNAPSLGGLTLRQISDDPQSGKTTREVVNLDLNEPDPSLFQPPEGYEVIEQEMHPVACQH